MNTPQFVSTALQMSSGWIGGLMEDAASIPFQQPTPNGGNHPLWIIGHLAYSEAQMVYEMVEGKENPLRDWAPLFGMGASPETDPSKYPPIEDVLQKAKEVRAHSLEVLESLTDADFDRPSHGPDEMREMFGTVGACFAAVCVHYGFHGGQLADCRRAAGRGPLMG